MRTLKFALSAAFLFICLQLFSQHSFDWIDSATYDLYMKKDWKQLSKLGKEVDQPEFDYFYNNMRVGIAYFQRMQYEKAKKFFLKAKKNDASDPYPNEYLFWSEYLLGNEKDAYGYYQLLPDSIRLRTDYHPKRILESIYLEGGAKLSDSTPIAGHVGYVQLGFNHKFSPSFSVFQAYTYQRQEAVWGSFQQHQYYVAPKIQFRKNMYLKVAFHYAHYKSNIEFRDRFMDVFPSPTPPQPPPLGYLMIFGFHNPHDYGQYTENMLLAQATLSKTIKGFTVEPHIAFSNTWRKPEYFHTHIDSFRRDSVIAIMPPNPPVWGTSYQVDTTIERMFDKENYWQLLLGSGFYYDFGRFKFGADVTAVIGDTVKAVIVTPMIRAILAKWLTLSAFYTYKGNYPVAIDDGYQLYNNFDKIKYKTSITTDFSIMKKLNLYLTYQFEGINDNFSKRDYKLHTLLIGLNLRL